MNRGEVRTQVTADGRFNSNQSGQINTWIDTAYAWVWDEADWTFKRVDERPVDVQQGDRDVVLPVEYGYALQVFTDEDVPLDEISPDDYSRWYLGSDPGVPERFTLLNGKVRLGPVPAAAATYKLSFYAQMFVLQNDGVTPRVGGFATDTDLPAFYPQSGKHHQVLVHRASMIGQALDNDPSATINEQLAGQIMASMVSDRVLLKPPERPLQYGWSDPDH